MALLLFTGQIPWTPNILTSFQLLSQIPETVNISEEKDYFSSQFWGISPWSVGPVALRLVAEQHTLVAAHDKTVHLVAKRERRGG